MQIIHVDDEILATDTFMYLMEQLNTGHDIDVFNEPEDALEFAKYTKVDMAFLDIEMFSMNGIELARKLKEINKDIKIVFMTAYNNYAMEAFSVEAQGYLLKPYNKDQLADMLRKLTPAPTEKKPIFIRTMPRFDVFVNGQAVVFNGSKVKELLAFLVDANGSVMTARQIITAMWEDSPIDDSASSRLRNIIKRLHDNLAKYGIDELLQSNKNNRYVKVEMYDSDYKHLMQGDAEALDQYDGRYLDEYWWAEDTRAQIDQMVRQKRKQ